MSIAKLRKQCKQQHRGERVDHEGNIYTGTHVRGHTALALNTCLDHGAPETAEEFTSNREKVLLNSQWCNIAVAHRRESRQRPVESVGVLYSQREVITTEAARAPAFYGDNIS